jgi:hypothetical protein
VVGFKCPTPLYIINCVQNARVFSVAQLKQQDLSAAGAINWSECNWCFWLQLFIYLSAWELLDLDDKLYLLTDRLQD